MSWSISKALEALNGSSARQEVATDDISCMNKSR